MTEAAAIGIIFAILVIVAIAVPWFITRSRRRQRRRYEDVPPALRPAYSDEQLEKSVIERYMGWGLVLTALFAVFFPIYWIQETHRIQNAEAGQFTSSVATGEELYVDNCSECHGDNARGGATASPYASQEAAEEGEEEQDPEAQDDEEEEQGQPSSWPAPDLLTVVERYEENPNVDDVRQYVRETIERGRPGTPMPAWGQAHQGPLTDVDVEAIVDWIMVNQVEGEADEAASTDASGQELFASNCAQCHGPDARGQVGPSLVGVFERHDETTIMGILRNGIFLADGLSMPPWQNGYMYDDARYDDETLARIVDYLREIQPDELPEGADQYQTPGVRQDDGQDQDPETADAAG